MVGEDRHADLSAAVSDHEIHDVGRRLLGSADEVSLILTVLGIDHDHHLATANGGYGGIDRRKLFGHGDSSFRMIIG